MCTAVQSQQISALTHVHTAVLTRSPHSAPPGPTVFVFLPGCPLSGDEGKEWRWGSSMWGRWGGTKISRAHGGGGGGLRDSGDTAVPWSGCVCCAWGVPMGILHWGAARISPECSIECHRAAVRLQRTSSGVFLGAAMGWIILGQQQHSQGAAMGFQWDSNGVSMGKPMGFPWGCEVPMGHKPPGQWQLRGQPHRDMSPPHPPPAHLP